MNLARQPIRSGYVGLIGRPNVGKSTLLNRLVGQKISITSRRPQTTRHRVLGVLTTSELQFVFVDTPGIQRRHGGELNRRLSRAVAQAFELMDAVMIVIEPRLTAEDRRIIAGLPGGLPAVLAINKIDALEDKSALLPLIQDASAAHDWRAVVPVSARTGSGIDDLLGAMAPLLRHDGLLYGEDDLTDRSERFLAAELVREKLFRLLGEEVPYATAVDVEQFEHAGSLRRIHATILVDKPGQKAIVIGKGGAKLKEIGTQARLDMEKLFGGKVHLELWVKVREGWAEDPALLKRLGYD